MKTIKILMMAVLTILSVSVFAQDSVKHKTKNQKQKVEKVKYSCPMHPEVTSDKPGTCTQCGMSLTLSPKEKMKMEVMKIYTCPMHPQVHQSSPGNCPRCGMTLERRDVAGVHHA